MSTPAPQARSDPQPADRDRAPRLWGLDPRSLHDHYWAGHGVCVVRRRMTGTLDEAPLYLLLDQGHGAVFNITRTVRRAARREARLVQVCIRDARTQPYREHVVADADDRFLALTRDYDAGERHATSLLVTGDRRIATLWQQADCDTEAKRLVRLAVGPRGERHTVSRGMVMNLADPDDGAQAMQLVLSTWRNPASTIPGLTRPSSGIWVHHSARVDPRARLLAPLWIGAGVQVGARDVLLGPGVIEDVKPLRSAKSHAARCELISPLPPTAPVDVIQPRRRLGKRAFDIAFSLAALLAAAPLLPLIMLAICLEDGRPVLFRHVRQTRGGRQFNCCKFRTMSRHAELMKAQLAGKNVCDGPQFHVVDDPRLLRVGKFLRRFHLDELPQFFNVLAGDMTVIGPRPSPDGENQFCPAWREARLSVRPGITGLWQVRRTRAPNTDFQEWIRHDLEYVTRQNWRMDLWILLETVRCTLLGERHATRVARELREQVLVELTDPPPVLRFDPHEATLNPQRKAA